MKKISFIVLTHNSEKFIKDCIESILNIKKFEKHIYVIDNGSEDESAEIVSNVYLSHSCSPPTDSALL